MTPGRRAMVGVTIGLALVGSGALARAQHGGHGPAPGAAGHAHAPASPGDGAVHGHRQVLACAEEFEAVVRDGRGAGLAFAADRHGYPGPLHALELAAPLGLEAPQRARLQALLDGMFARSRPQGARLAAAEAALEQLFASGGADEAAVRAAVAAAERARAELRLVHLLTHLETRAVLSEAQRRAYHEARWGAPR